MLRKMLFVSGLAVVGIALWAGVSGSGHTAGQPQPPRALPPGAQKGASFVHAVIFHLKKGAPEGEAAALIRDAHELLQPIPSVRGLRVGRPAEKGTPDLAKKDFEVGLLVLFDDFEGLHTYLNHPQHLKYVQKHQDHVDFEKLQVYDFVNQDR